MGVTDFKHWSSSLFEGSEERKRGRREEKGRGRKEGRKRKQRREESASREKWSGTSIYKLFLL